jgi:hypothetical protein
MKSVGWLSCGLAVLYALSYVASRAYLRSYDTWRLTEIAAEHLRTDAYRRSVLAGDPTEQNAAIWYRRSFARLQLLPEGSERVVASAVVRLSNRADPALLATAGQSCEEASSARMFAARHAARCDWELPSLNDDDQINAKQAWLLGNCMVLRGYHDAWGHDRGAAAQGYFEALSFASDLSQADYSASFVSMTIAGAALEGLANTAAGWDDTKSLRATRETLSHFATRLPTIDAGLRLARLEIATLLQIDAMASGGHRPWDLHAIWWPLVGARRLARHSSLLKLLQQLSETRTTADRKRLATTIDNLQASTTDRTVKAVLPIRCLGAVMSEEYLHQIYTATQAAIELEERRLDYERFPEAAESLDVRPVGEGLHYEQLDGGHGYRIMIDQWNGRRTVFERRSSRSSWSFDSTSD